MHRQQIQPPQGLDMNTLFALSQLMPGGGMAQGLSNGTTNAQNMPDVQTLLAMLGNIANGR